ncbi:MAG TPA: hypothetical protein VLI90_02425 [Tepidisphaeraceae bacterium]|nr:hypothetical protein [Tepidisphaeraceae bacterium]
MRFRKSKFAQLGLGTILVAAAVGATPASALAGRHDDFDRRDYRDHDRGDLRIGLDLPGIVVEHRYTPPPCDPVETRVWVEPVYRTVCDRQWMPATYRTVCDRVWVEPVTRTVCDRVYVPDRYEWRDVVRYEYGYRRVARERVLVEPAHYVEQPHQIVVTPGHYQDVQRQELVCDGHWDNVEHQELVTPGHWETRERIVERPLYEEHAGVRLDLRFPIR